MPVCSQLPGVYHALSAIASESIAEGPQLHLDAARAATGAGGVLIDIRNRRRQRWVPAAWAATRAACCGCPCTAVTCCLWQAGLERSLLPPDVLTSGYALFGEDTEGDVLKNLTARAVSHLVPVGLAHSLVYGIAVAFSFNLLVNFVLKVGWPGLAWAGLGWPGLAWAGQGLPGAVVWLAGFGGGSRCRWLAACTIKPSAPVLAATNVQVWAVRESVCELALGVPALQLAAGPFYCSTALLVAAAFGISIMVPSIYQLLALVGSTACVTFSYVFPSLLILRCQRGLAARAGALGLLTLGAAMAAIAVYNRLAGQGGA